MRITIKDIARECGVSVSTVSMALSDKKTRISEKTRQRIAETARKYNYQPNGAAVSLVNRRSKMIGIVFNDLRNTHISSLFMAIGQVIEARGYSLVCHILDGKEKSDLRLVRTIASENVCALIWARSMECGEEPDRESLARGIEGLGLPVMTMDAYGFRCPGADVCFDYEQGGYLAAKHLIECGHRRIGCVAGERSFKVTGQRLEGYKRALGEAGLPYEEQLVYYGDYTMDSGYRALSYLMGQKVTAVFSMNDEMAFGMYRAARNYGVRIPEELSIVGFDGVPFADVMEAPLSTVRVPVEEMGAYIGRRLIELLEEPAHARESGNAERETVLYQPHLLLRASTKRLADEEK